MTTHAEQIEQHNGITVVSMALDGSGKANSEAVRHFFSTRFLDVTEGTVRLVVDLDGIATLDSAALGPLVQRLREVQQAGGRMALCSVNASGLREIFALTRFDQIFPIFPDRQQALDSLAE